MPASGTAVTSNVTVVVRVRPLNEREKCRGAQSLVTMHPDGRETILSRPSETDAGNARAVSRRIADSRSFNYDHSLYSADRQATNYASQTDLFDCLGRGFVDHAFGGYNCCILAYGQTGAGKTYSMIGSDSEPGLIPLICDNIFERIESSPVDRFDVSCSYYEIYNEAAIDLLLPRDGTNPPRPLKVRESPETGPYLERLSEFGVRSAMDVQAFMNVGNQYRKTASTKMNDTSSRSHAVFTLTIRHESLDSETGTVVEKTSRFRLVDLAGSERASATGATGERLREGAKINKSLTTLGRVIAKLADPKHSGPVPYRDSILTWLMSDSLGGNSKTAMLACVSPADYDETLSTLRYADAVKMIATRAVVNSKAGEQQSDALEARLCETLQLLATTRQEKVQLQHYESTASELRAMVESVTTSSRLRIASLEREVEALRTHLRLALEALKNPFPDFAEAEEDILSDIYDSDVSCSEVNSTIDSEVDLLTTEHTNGSATSPLEDIESELAALAAATTTYTMACRSVIV